ncbi:MAG TPA: WD40 repeat domain-containing protein [Cyclobacteriaceae bacterium]|nr:WD40 repeat domain-containing protein [Cyclobacteriaceae bacterium]
MNIQVTKLHSFTGHRDSVYALQGSSSDHLFFSASGDGMVVMWDLNQPDNGELIARLPNSIYALLFHDDRDVLVAGHNYEGIHLLDWKNKTEVGSLQITKAAVFDIQYLGDTLFIATGDGTVHVVDIGRLSVLNKIQVSEKSARTIAINPARGEFAVGYSDHQVRIFDMERYQLKHEYLAHQNSVFTLRYTPDGRYLLSGSRDARLKAWDVNASYKLATEVVAHMYAINHIEFSPDNKHFVTCSLDKSIKVWDAEELRLLKVIDKARHAGHGTSVNKLLWTPFQNQLLSASDDRSVSSWKINFETEQL